MLDLDSRKRRLSFRAWHRGTKEADIMIGGFVTARLDSFSLDEMAWLERFLEETDVDIMSWITGTQPVPEAWQGELMTAMQRLDYIRLSQ
jgi:antitoxin CptB